MTGKVTDDALKQELLNVIDMYELNPKIKTDKRKKRLIADSWKMYIGLAMEKEADSLNRCLLHSLYTALSSFEYNELTCEQFIDYARFLVANRFS